MVCKICKTKKGKIRYSKIFKKYLCGNHENQMKIYNKIVNSKINNYCNFCGKTNIRSLYNPKYGNYLCIKHYHHINLFGKPKMRTQHTPNEFVIKEEYAEMLMYKKGTEIEKGKTTIDKEDVERCRKYKWNLSNRNYIQNGKTRRRLSRFLLKYTGPLYVDNINGNKLDNRKENLIIVTNSNFKAGSSGVKGVTRQRIKNDGTQTWSAKIRANGKRITLGTFDSLEEAAKARKEAEIKYFGEYRYKAS